MFKGKPLLPKSLLKYEFEVYIIILFISRFFPVLLIPIIHFPLVTYFTSWLHDIYIIQQKNGILNVWTPYPFLFNLYSYILNFLTMNSLLNFSVIFYFINAICDSITGILIWKILEESPNHYSQYVRWLYLSSPLPLFWIYTQQVYDPVVILFLVLGYYFINKKSKLSTFFISVGTSLKIIPIFIYGSCLFDKNMRKIFFKYLPFLILGLIVFNVPIFFNLNLYTSSLAWQSNRPAWESMFGLFDYLKNGFYIPTGAYSNCPSDSFTLQLVGFHMIGITPCPSIFSEPLKYNVSFFSQSILKTISLALVVIFTIVFLYFATSKLTFEKITLGLLSLIFAFSFGFSPQYALYELVILIIASKPEKIIFNSIVLQLLLLIEYPFLSILVPMFFHLSVDVILIPFWFIVFVRSFFLIYIAMSVMLNKI